jgi:hypothetical protein
VAVRIIYESTKGQVGRSFIVSWIVACLLLVALTEAVIGWARHQEESVQFAASQYKITDHSPSLAERLLKAKDVVLVGGTFKTFTDRAENLDALLQRTAMGSERSTRLLILSPKARSLADIARARHELGRLVRLEDLEQEIRRSLARLAERLGDRMASVVKIYDGPLSVGIYRFDDEFMLTLYTYGRGASSPSILIRRSPEHSSFLDSVSRGVEEIWKAPSSVPATRETLVAVGVVFD